MSWTGGVPVRFDDTPGVVDGGAAVSTTPALSLTTLSQKDTNASTTSSAKMTRPVSLRGLSSQFESTPIAMPMNTKAIPSVVYTATVCHRARRRLPGDRLSRPLRAVRCRTGSR